jgi:hypothetical protein
MKAAHRRMFQRASILKYLTEHQKTISFWIAAALGLAVAIWANALPYLRTRGAAGFDGVEITGFPFVFRSFGGFSPAFEFSQALSADIAIAIAFSLCAGVAAKRLIGLRGRRRRFAWCAGPPSRRPPWQFSLRQLLLIVAIVSAACAADKYLAAVMNRWPYP